MTVVYRVLRSTATDQDLAAIFDFVADSAEALGEASAAASDIAERRVRAIVAAMEGLGMAPHQGTRRPELGSGIRHVTKERAIFYFDLDDAARTLRILAVFFGGQDHDARILVRLMKGR